MGFLKGTHTVHPSPPTSQPEVYAVFPSTRPVNIDIHVHMDKWNIMNYVFVERQILNTKINATSQINS